MILAKITIPRDRPTFRMSRLGLQPQQLSLKLRLKGGDLAVSQMDDICVQTVSGSTLATLLDSSLNVTKNSNRPRERRGMDLAQNRNGAAQKLWPLDSASIWKPLDKEKRQIRIILLQPSEEEDDALYADLEIVSLDSEPEYKAISYVWGDASDTTIMFVNGGKAIKITKSLAAALRCFRDSRAFVALWADAVCINQENLQERADQVRIMGRIYATAIQVNIWLGRMSDRGWHDALYSQLEAELLPWADGILKIGEQFFESLLPQVAGGPNIHTHELGLEPWITWIDILSSSPWFSRLWAEEFWDAVGDAGADPGRVLTGLNCVTLQHHVSNAQLFVTTSGRLGNARPGVRVGDLVVLLPGCNIPFVIRPVEETTEQKEFRLVSPCYVNGMMDGEALWDAFIAKANPAEKTEFQNELDAMQEEVAAGIEDEEIKARRAELADKHCRHLFEDIVLV
ncbi:hypothetical protein KC331_g420 [Hortaea werneckii]|nr:hypothetical protein KC331_g420 [Hortaea werneckii]KAI7721802.1 hypothetical protein KC353_g1078 [Hortaea werneckii]